MAVLGDNLQREGISFLILQSVAVQVKSLHGMRAIINLLKVFPVTGWDPLVSYKINVLNPN